MMLLANLNKYAVEHNLGTPFQERTIDFRLSFNDQGYVGMSVAEEGTKIRAAVVQRTTACVPYQFYDDPEFVLGVSDHGKRDRKTKEGLTAFEVFWQQAEKTLQGAGDTAALEALRRLRLSEAKWLSRAREYVQENFKPSGNKKKPYIALSYKSELLVDRPLVREYFEGLFADQLRRVDGPDTCLVTGDKCTAVKTHRQIAGVPGCSPAAAFISFSDMSSRLGRFSSDENVFPVSPPVMLRYTSALNSLLETNSAYVPADTCIVFWEIGRAHV